MLAIIAATAGTATAAFTITGLNVRNGTLTGIDFRDRTLAGTDFPIVRFGAKGITGATGETGSPGAAGSRGLAGPAGVNGTHALRQFTFSYRDADARFNSIQNENTSALPWYVRGQSVDGFKSPEFLDNSARVMTDSGNASNAGGALVVPRASDVVLTATISIAHRGDARCSNGAATSTMTDPGNNLMSCTSPSTVTASEADDVNVHTRAECWAEYGNADGSAFTPIGVPVYVSASSTYRLVNVPVTAGVTVQPGTYNFRTYCRSADRTADAQHNDWEFVHANMSVLVATDRS